MTTATSVSRSIALALVPLALSGCGLSRLLPSAAIPLALHVQGGVHGGLQPVVGSTVQLFDATAGGTALISTTVTSDANGNFTLTGDYTCPASSDQVYIVASGGNPGAGQNDSLVLMSAMGNCGDLTPSTYVNLNEVTTVATIYAYAQDFTPFPTTPLGYIDVDDPAAYATFLSMVDPGSGIALTYSNPASPMELNTLANIVATCVNATTVAGVTQPCIDLINMAAPPYGSAIPQDSAIAIYLIASNTTYNVTGTFNDAVANPPFQPALTTAPANWQLP
jgi:hypothetical protein